MIHHLVFRGILQDDPFFFIKKIKRRNGTDIIKIIRTYYKIGIETVIPLLRINRHIVTPSLKILIYIYIKDCKRSVCYIIILASLDFVNSINFAFR